MKQSQIHLLALAMGGFSIGLAEFVIMGLLPNVAAFFRINIPTTAYLISAYAFGVVIGAPVLTILGRQLAPKQLLIVLMLLFTLFNALSALVTQFGLLVFLRFLSGLPHGAFFGLGAIVASRLAPVGKSSSAIATMFSGLTIANVVGVPVGTWLGVQLGWQWQYILVATLGFFTVLAILTWIPTLPREKTPAISEELKVFKRLNLWLSIAITSIGFGGFFAWISYIAPLLTDIALFSKASIPLWMTLIGIGMTIGVILGGKVADKMAPAPATLLWMLAVMITLILNALLAHHAWLMPFLVLLTSTCALAQCPSIQMLLIENAKGAETLGASLGQSGFNIGNTLGAFLGGIPLLMGYSYLAPLWVGALMCLIGVLLSLILIKRTAAINSTRSKEHSVKMTPILTAPIDRIRTK